jgi:hypothetical protein
MFRKYVQHDGSAVSRPRGKSPQQAAFFTRTPQLQEETSLLASLCCLLGVLPHAGTSGNPEALVSLPRGELLCQAVEVYRELVSDARISFEHLVFLVSALAGGQELALAKCEICGTLKVIDRFTLKAHCCPHCANAGAADSGGH